MLSSGCCFKGKSTFFPSKLALPAVMIEFDRASNNNKAVEGRGLVFRQPNRQTDRQIYEWTDGWIDGWMDVWIDGWMDR